MATRAFTESGLDAAVRRATDQLVCSRVWADAAFVDLPIFHPSGAAATVKVELTSHGFRVSDGGFAYREIELIGAERQFAKAAAAAAEEIGAEIVSRAIVLLSDPDSLPGVIAEVASASSKLSHKISAKVGAKGEAEIADHLYERLVAVFGSMRVEPQVTMIGPSTKEWHLDALVRLEDRQAVFQAVTSHHASVYSTSAMFHDLALIERAPVMVSVVKDRAELGAFLGILAQAGHVIEESQPDMAYETATNWSIPAR